MSHVFRGRTLTEARSAAHTELGPEAVVLGQRKVRRKGVTGLFGATEFEVEAGVRLALPELPAARADAAADDAPHWKAPTPFAPGVYESARRASRGNEIERLEQEVRAVRAMLHRMSQSPQRLESELASLRRVFDDMAPRGSVPAKIDAMLQMSGVQGEAAKRIAKTLGKHKGDDDTLYDAYRDALADLLRVRPWPLASDERKVVAVVGPPGVGKTTTLAKIAARALGDGRSIGFVSCDTYRVGAVEQINRYAALLEAPVAIARTQDELHRAIRESTAEVVLVDTAGRGPSDEASVEAGLGAARLERERPTGWEDRARHVLLCLDAALRWTDADELARRYGLCAPTSIAVTKLDLTRTPGALVHGTSCTNIGVAALCTGQRVPEDITPATAGAMLDYLAPRGRSGLRS